VLGRGGRPAGTPPPPGGVARGPNPPFLPPPPPAAGRHPMDTRTYGILPHTTPKPTISHRLCGLYEARSLEGIPHSTPTEKKEETIWTHYNREPHPSPTGAILNNNETALPQGKTEPPKHVCLKLQDIPYRHTQHNLLRSGGKHADIIKQYCNIVTDNLRTNKRVI